jgi:1,6-anhydro-N-acetylmuramate kinase
MSHGPQRRLVAGVMTGTSIDGIDAALVEVRGRGLGIQARLLAHGARPLRELQARLAAAAAGTPMAAGAFARMARDLGHACAAAIADLLPRDERLDLAAIHGQTIFHDPPLSWQVLNPAAAARRLGCAVVSDLRAADLAAGGQGAPITPLADWVIFRHPRRRRVVLNLGGFCNLTALPRGDDADPLPAIDGCDVCACNQALDAVARAALHAPFDRDGRAAASGRPDSARAGELAEILAAQAAAARSLGSADAGHVDWVRRGAAELCGPELAASAVTAVATVIAAAVPPHAPDEVIVAGGGARNLALVAALRRLIAAPLATSDDHGMPVEAREAAAIAVLGALCADRVPITLPQVTGCGAPAPLAGQWTFPGGISAASPPAT